MVLERSMIGGVVMAGVFVACGGSIENAAASDPPPGSTPSSPAWSAPSYPVKSPFTAPPDSAPTDCGSCFVAGTAVCAADWALAKGGCSGAGWECCEPRPGAPAPTPPPDTSLLCWDDGPYPASTCFGSPCPAASVCEYTEPNAKGETSPRCREIKRQGNDKTPKGTCFIANCGTVYCKGAMICTDPVNGRCE